MNTFRKKNYMPTLKEYRRLNKYGVKCLVCVKKGTKIKDKSIKIKVSHTASCVQSENNLSESIIKLLPVPLGNC